MELGTQNSILIALIALSAVWQMGINMYLKLNHIPNYSKVSRICIQSYSKLFAVLNSLAHYSQQKVFPIYEVTIHFSHNHPQNLLQGTLTQAFSLSNISARPTSWNLSIKSSKESHAIVGSHKIFWHHPACRSEQWHETWVVHAISVPPHRITESTVV